MSEVVHLENLTKEYAEGERRRAVLRGVTASFERGEFVAIRGRSGSGKSTLLNLIAGIDTPTAGEITIAGTPVTRLSARDRTLFRRDHIGFVFQFFNLIPTLTVLENVLLPAELGGLNGRDPAERAMDLLRRVDLADRRDAFPDRLSGGEQQRVAIARALVRDPRLVLADEPTGNLDEATGDLVMRLLSELTHESGRTLLLVTHSHRIASRADRVLELQEGRLVMGVIG